ncbi:MAG: tetratricopeptide repeat protein [Synergistaceae bacterium]|jgi:tetratricopeptide (TPR) repeat protein|nr:tetratricopeptide repeat protein [Synergistaceae bacterium]
MRFKRSSFAPLTFLAVFLLSQTCQKAEGEAGNVETVKEFLERTPLSAAEQRDILETIRSKTDPGTPSRREWVLSGDGKVYSLVLVPVQKDRRATLQARLEEMASTKANLRAHHLLYLRAWSGARRKTRYANGESVAEALTEWDRGRGEGERLKPDLSVAAVSKDWAFALVRIPEESVKALGAQIDEMPENTLDTAYCEAIYPKAKELFEQRRYEAALPVYRELRGLRWARPAAYLDAAECLLRTGDPKSAASLTQETATEWGDVMDHTLLRRAGDILLDAGEEAPAERLYRRAVEKLRQE